MRLSRLALPPEADNTFVKKAINSFSTSVTVQTQTGYASAARAYIQAENALGRPFSLPPTDQEMIFLMSFLINKNLEPSTIRNYLSGIRFYLFSMGLANPPALPQLANQLLAGYEKDKINPQLKAAKKTRRAITIEMLKLLEHSIACQDVWSDFEKSLRWTVILVAWWGSFRIGELLPRNSTSFHQTNTLLASDITCQEGSIAIWLRHPKVNREALGDIVEIWSVERRPDLDPVHKLKAYLYRRNMVFGATEAYPLFLHEDGRIYTKHELNRDLSLLLSQYPELQTEKDSWTGHSFRSGLTTVLSNLGFSDAEIKSWGRWSSGAFKVYVKSQSQRQSVRSKLIKTFDSILKYI